MQLSPSRILVSAEEIDNFLSIVANDSVNLQARRSTEYRPWPDQSLAEKIVLEKRVPTDVQLVILSPSAEAGMPHTRAGRVICLPAYFPEKILGETLRHEMIHIDQHRNAIAWNKKLLKEGWTPISESKIPVEWLSRCRLNPDTISSRFWAWQGRWVALPVFQRVDQPQLREIEVRWLDLQEETTLRQAPASYINTYGQRTPSEQEHPFELFAYLGEQ